MYDQEAVETLADRMGVELKEGKWGQPLPQRFTVRCSRLNTVLGVMTVIFCGLMTAFCVMMVCIVEERRGQVYFALLTVLLLALAGLGVYCFRQGKNWRLEVDGEQLYARSVAGKRTMFRASDIAYVTGSVVNTRINLCGRDGEVLFTAMTVMKNIELLGQYLDEHGVKAVYE